MEDELEFRCFKDEESGSFHVHFSVEKLVECLGVTTFTVQPVDVNAPPEAPPVATLPAVPAPSVGLGGPGRFGPTAPDAGKVVTGSGSDELDEFDDLSRFRAAVNAAIKPSVIDVHTGGIPHWYVEKVKSEYRELAPMNREFAKEYLQKLLRDAMSVTSVAQAKALMLLARAMVSVDTDRAVAPMVPVSTAPAPAPAWAAPEAPWRKKEPKESQLDYVEKLGGSRDKAESMTRGECSDYISGLKSGAIPPEPDAPAKEAAPEPGEFVAKPKSRIPIPLLDMVAEGYYAAQAEDGAPITFLRVSRPKSGRYKGCTKVQHQESDRLNTDLVVWPDGKISVYATSMEDALLLVIADRHEAARRYAREMNRCAKCRASLTDERSRKYGIGPECEKHWPWMITLVDEEEELKRAAS